MNDRMNEFNFICIYNLIISKIFTHIYLHTHTVTPRYNQRKYLPTVRCCAWVSTVCLDGEFAIGNHQISDRTSLIRYNANAHSPPQPGSPVDCTSYDWPAQNHNITISHTQTLTHTHTTINSHTYIYTYI
jgi:hypothetical protein